MKRLKRKTTTTRREGISEARFAEMIEQATVDACGESEQATGWFTMFEEHLVLPFETDVLGVRVKVETIELCDDAHIVVVCKRGKHKQLIAISDLPLPTPRPPGAEWIEAYRHWRGKC